MAHWPIPAAKRFKAWVHVHSLAGIAGSNPARCTDVSHFIVVCCQVEVSGQADHSSRGILMSVVCPSVTVKPHRGNPGALGLLSHKK